jgi:hypothetical protein
MGGTGLANAAGISTGTGEYFQLNAAGQLVTLAPSPDPVLVQSTTRGGYQRALPDMHPGGFETDRDRILPGTGTSAAPTGATTTAAGAAVGPSMPAPAPPLFGTVDEGDGNADDATDNSHLS